MTGKELRKAIEMLSEYVEAADSLGMQLDRLADTCKDFAAANDAFKKAKQKTINDRLALYSRLDLLKEPDCCHEVCACQNCGNDLQKDSHRCNKCGCTQIDE